MKIKSTKKAMANSERLVQSLSKCRTTPSSISLMIENEVWFDKRKVAEYCNEYFTSIASSLVEKLPLCSGRFGDAHIIDCHHKQNVSDNILDPVSVTVEQISSLILNNISVSKATVLDELPARFIKDDSSLIAKPFAHSVKLLLYNYIDLYGIFG